MPAVREPTDMGLYDYQYPLMQSFADYSYVRTTEYPW